MKTFTEPELQEILNNHKHWCDEDCEVWKFMRADLSYANLRSVYLRSANLRDADLKYADLRKADLRDADLRGADLRGANMNYADIRNADLRGANLRGANLRGANLECADMMNVDLNSACLSNADLSYADLRDADLKDVKLNNANLSSANLSNAKNILSPINYLTENFKFITKGMVAYKTFNESYCASEKWVIQKGSVITENCNPNRTEVCGCGINIAPLEWVKRHYGGDIWKVLIRWEWLAGVIVPYNTDGKIRCEKCELLDIVDR